MTLSLVQDRPLPSDEHRIFCLRRLLYWVSECERCYRLALMQAVGSKAEHDYEVQAERASGYVADYSRDLGL